MIVRKELMRPSEDQPKLNRRPNEHVWHALWHALRSHAGKTDLKFSQSKVWFSFTEYEPPSVVALFN